MADGSEIDRKEPAFGLELERLLDRLHSGGVLVGPRERVAALLLGTHWLSAGDVEIDVLAPGREARLMRTLRPVLAPALARTLEEREIFHRIFDSLYPSQPAATTESTSPRNQQVRAWYLRPLSFLFGALILVVAIAALLLLFRQTDPGSTPAEPRTATSSSAEDLNSSAAVDPKTSLTGPLAPSRPAGSPQASSRLLQRVMNSAVRHGDAPTLEEIAADVFEDPESLKSAARTNANLPGWTVESYAVRLHELTGLPLGRPLRLLSSRPTSSSLTASPTTTITGAGWARLALALGRIETPGLEPEFSRLEAEASLAAQKVQLSRTATIATRLSSYFPDRDAFVKLKSGQILGSVARDPDVAGAPVDEIVRALALEGYPVDAFGRPPWAAPPKLMASHSPPVWLPWVAGGVPMILALLVILSALLRRPYLRRRPPRVPPLHTDLVTNASRRVIFNSGLFQRAAQRLLTRMPRPTADLDITRTVAETLRAGGEEIQPVFSAARARPEYLVLIERSAAGDHETQRMRLLVERLKALIDIDVYTFQTDPGELEPEDGRQRILIEQAQSRHPDHRLLVLGSGHGLLEPLTLSPRESARKLMFWERRALLTPIPLAEWRAEEYALAESLAMPVGRATAAGLLALAELIGLEGGEVKARPSPHGDGLARPLPEILRLRPQRFLFNAEPDKSTLEELMREMRNTLDPPAFDWFAALAVYPAVQWDLTLFLGVELPLLPGGDVEVDPLYDEDRLAQITQLPWLRAGRMPDWLRHALLDRLAPVRAAEIRSVIEKAIEAGRTGDEADLSALRLRIGREPPKESLAPGRLFEDEVLLDFLSGRRQGDFALPRLVRPGEVFSRTFLEHFGGAASLACVVALVYAISAFALAPTGSEPTLSGAFAPLVILTLGGLFVAAVWRPNTMLRQVASLSERMAPPALALFVAGTVLYLPKVAGMAAPDAGESAWLVSWGMLAGITAALLLPARFIADRVGLRVFAPPAQSSIGLLFLLRAAFLSPLLVLIPQWIAPSLYWNLAPLLVVFAGVLSASLAPQGRGPSRHGMERRRGGRLAVVLRSAAASVPIAVAFSLAGMVGNSSMRWSLQLQPVQVAQSADSQLFAVADAVGRISIGTRDGRLLSSQPPIEFAQTTIAALAIAGAPASPVVAFGDADGRVFTWQTGQTKTVELLGQTRSSPLASNGSAPLVSYGPGATLYVAYEVPPESGASSRIIRGDDYAGLEATLGPPSAMAAIDSQRVAIATLDGSIHVIRFDAGKTVIALAPSDDASLAPARSLVYDPASQTLRGLLVDGSLIEANLAEGKAGSLVRVGYAPGLALGFAPAWSQKNDAVDEPVATSPSASIGASPPPARPSAPQPGSPSLLASTREPEPTRSLTAPAGTSAAPPQPGPGPAGTPGSGQVVAASPGDAPKPVSTVAASPGVCEACPKMKRLTVDTVPVASTGSSVSRESPRTAFDNGEQTDNTGADVIFGLLNGEGQRRDPEVRRPSAGAVGPTSPVAYLSEAYISGVEFAKCISVGFCTTVPVSSVPGEAAVLTPGSGQRYAGWLRRVSGQPYRLPYVEELFAEVGMKRPAKNCQRNLSGATDWELTLSTNNSGAPLVFSRARKTCAVTDSISNTKYLVRLARDGEQ